MNTIKSIASFCVAIFTSLWISIAQADHTLVWDKNPITLVIPVGEEVRVSFPTEVAIQVPASLKALDSLAPNQQIIYWTANEAFEKTRIIATSVDNKSVYLIDIAAVAGTPKENYRIEDADRVVTQQPTVSANEISENANTLTDPPEIVLTRFASQTLYAPRRLMPVNADIAAQPLPTLGPDFPLLKSQMGEKYRLSVVGAWAGYGFYLTAVLVVNQSNIPININPGLVQGNFTHVTAQHLGLSAKGSLEDRTTLYLISSVPFASALQEDGYGY